MARRILNSARDTLRTHVGRPSVTATVVALPMGTGRAVLAGHTPTSIAIPAFVADAGLSLLSRVDRRTQETWMSALANVATGVVEVQEAMRHASCEYLGPVGSGSNDWYWQQQGYDGPDASGDDDRKRRRHRRRHHKRHGFETERNAAGEWGHADGSHGSHGSHGSASDSKYHNASGSATANDGGESGDSGNFHDHMRDHAKEHWDHHRKQWDKTKFKRRRRRGVLRRFAAKVRDRLVPEPNERLMRAMPWQFREGDRLEIKHTVHIPAPIAQTLLASVALSQRVKSTGALVGSATGSFLAFTAFSCLPGSSIAGFYLLYRAACNAQARKGAAYVIDAMEDDAVDVTDPSELSTYVEGRKSLGGDFHIDMTDVGRLAVLSKVSPGSLRAAFESTLLHGPMKLPQGPTFSGAM